jgi:hypothetical protein
MPVITGQRRADRVRVRGELTRGKLFPSAFVWVWHMCIRASAMPVRVISALPRIGKNFLQRSRETRLPLLARGQDVRCHVAFWRDVSAATIVA